MHYTKIINTFTKIDPAPLDKQLIYGEYANLNKISDLNILLAQFKYCLLHRETNTQEYTLLHNYLIKTLGEDLVKKMEVLYE